MGPKMINLPKFSGVRGYRSSLGFRLPEPDEARCKNRWCIHVVQVLSSSTLPSVGCATRHCCVYTPHLMQCIFSFSFLDNCAECITHEINCTTSDGILFYFSRSSPSRLCLFIWICLRWDRHHEWAITSISHPCLLLSMRRLGLHSSQFGAHLAL